MDSERYRQVKEIFQAALDLPREERSAYVGTASGDDDEVRQEVLSLLNNEEETDGFLSRMAVDYVPGAPFAGGLPEDEIGRRIGPYQIVREIGAGGMGSVYLAERVDEFRQKAALKLMLRGMDSRAIVSRFRHERQILAGLDHPNIARLLDGGATDDGRPYFVMEYVEGTPIDAYCQKHTLEITGRLKLFRQVCAAVQYAHQNLVVHRDIKPGNILVTAGGAPKLLDFGIAKLLRREEHPDTALLTQAGMRMMTPEYASPEQVKGLPITTTSDVYSLGVVLYELLAGRLPYEFAAKSFVEVERVVCEQEPARPSALETGARAKRLAGDLDTIVLKALEKDPHRRYGSVEQLSEDIRRHLDGVPIAARPATMMYRAGKFVRRNRTGVFAAALVVLSLAGGLIATTRQAHIAQQQRARAERRFNEVRQVAESFLFEFDDKIRNLTGSTPARKLLVERALEYLRGLRPEAAGDAALSCDLAEAYLKVGDVQGNPYVSNIGDTAGALSSYRQALEIAQSAGAIEYQARAHRSIGEIAPLHDDLPGAVSEFRQAIALLETASVGAAEARFELSRSYEMLGDVLGHPGQPNLGDMKGARDAYEKGIAIDDGLIASRPESAQYRRARALLQVKIGDLLAEGSEWDAAIARYQEALRIFEELSGAEPNNAEAHRFAGSAARKLGEAYEALGKTREALEQYAKLAEGARRGMLADPTNVRASMDYAVALKQRADLLSKLERNQEALPVYREILDVIRPQYERDPTNNMLKDRYATLLVYIGDLLVNLHQAAEGRRLYQQGLDLDKQLADRPGATPGDVAFYAEYLVDASLPELHNPAQEIAYARRAVEMTKESSAFYLQLLARAYEDAQDAAEAVIAQQKAVALMPPSPERKAAEERLARFRSEVRKR